MYDSHFTLEVLLHFSSFLSLCFVVCSRAKKERDCMLISLLNLIQSQGWKWGGGGRDLM